MTLSEKIAPSPLPQRGSACLPQKEEGKYHLSRIQQTFPEWDHTEIQEQFPWRSSQFSQKENPHHYPHFWAPSDIEKVNNDNQHQRFPAWNQAIIPGHFMDLILIPETSLWDSDECLLVTDANMVYRTQKGVFQTKVIVFILIKSSDTPAPTPNRTSSPISPFEGCPEESRVPRTCAQTLTNWGKNFLTWQVLVSAMPCPAILEEIWWLLKYYPWMCQYNLPQMLLSHSPSRTRATLYPAYHAFGT